MSAALGACVVLLLGLAGGWPARRLLPELRGASAAAAALALGTAWVGMAQVLASLAGLPAGLLLPAVAAALSLACRVRDRRRVATFAGGHGDPRDPRDPPDTPPRIEPAPAAAAEVPRALALALLVVLLAATLVGAGLPFKGDGGKFWGPKARELAIHGALEAPFLTDGERLGFHRNYPLLGPALLAPVFGHGPPDAVSGPKLVLAAWLAALLVLLTRWLCAAGRAGRALAWTALGMPLLTASDVREGALSGGYLDALVALWVLLFVEALQRLRAAGDDPGARGRALALALLAGGALAGTKLEGGVWVACAAGAAWLAGPARRPVLVGAAGVALLALPAVVVFRTAQGDPALADPALADLGRLLEPGTWAARLPPLVAGLGGLLVDTSSFGLLPLGVLLVGWHHRRRVDAFQLWLLVALLAFLFVVYLTTTMHLGRHLFTSAHRLLWHWLPVAALLVARQAGAGVPRVHAAAEGVGGDGNGGADGGDDRGGRDGGAAPAGGEPAS